MVLTNQNARDKKQMRCDRDSRTGVADDVGDTRDATVGLWDDKDTKIRSLGQAGDADERDGELTYNHD